MFDVVAFVAGGGAASCVGRRRALEHVFRLFVQRPQLTQLRVIRPPLLKEAYAPLRRIRSLGIYPRTVRMWRQPLNAALTNLHGAQVHSMLREACLVIDVSQPLRPCTALQLLVELRDTLRVHVAVVGPVQANAPAWLRAQITEWK
jgi:hypothetical protein